MRFIFLPKALLVKLFDENFLRYILIGVVNTFLGYMIIFSLFYFNIQPELSNFMGYIIVITISYHLNTKYNFKRKSQNKNAFLQFVLSMLDAYLFNLLIFLVCYRIMAINMYISQLFAGLAYVLIGYFLTKFWIFKKNLDG